MQKDNIQQVTDLTFQNEFQNDRYEIILVLCDTDKEPYREYRQIKEKLIIFANPCTMQIILSHFGDVSLKTQSKHANAGEIEKWTGVKDYDAHEDQIKMICSKIFRRSYAAMKQRVAAINFSDTTLCSTNFSVFLERFENEDTKWISAIQKYLREKE